MPELKTLGSLLRKIDAPYETAQQSVLSRRVTIPPANPPPDARFIVPEGAVTAWARRTNQIAYRNDAQQWAFVAPVSGMSTWLLDEGFEVVFDGERWAAAAGSAELLGRGVVLLQNRRMPARATQFDADRCCDIAMAATPIAGSLVRFFVNGVKVSEIGDGVKTQCAVYFSGDGGYTPRRLVEIQIGDVPYWIGSYARYQIRSTFVLDYEYEVD